MTIYTIDDFIGYVEDSADKEQALRDIMMFDEFKAFSSNVQRAIVSMCLKSFAATPLQKVFIVATHASILIAAPRGTVDKNRDLVFAVAEEKGVALTDMTKRHDTKILVDTDQVAWHLHKQSNAHTDQAVRLSYLLTLLAMGNKPVANGLGSRILQDVETIAPENFVTLITDQNRLARYEIEMPVEIVTSSVSPEDSISYEDSAPHPAEA